MAKHTKNAGHTPAGKAAKPSAAAGRTAPQSRSAPRRETLRPGPRVRGSFSAQSP